MNLAQIAVTAVFAVSPGGDDANLGTAAAPWRTISHAARTVPPGAVVDVRAGIYDERVRVRVSGTADQPILFQAHPGEEVVVSGADLHGLRGQPGLIEIRDRAYLEFSGFELRDFVDGRRGSRSTPAGVWVTGTAHDVVLRGLDVHDIRTGHFNAHGIAVYGDARRPLRNVAVVHSYVHDLELGPSEAIVFNGNVDGWAATGNTIEHTNNIGIDAIGYEETAPVDDQARNGVIANNTITDVATAGNFAYEGCRCAGGIYVDGGRDILIESNRVTDSDLGIELASEHRTGTTSDIIVRNNLVRGSYRAGLTMGGYDRRRGTTERVQVVNNTFFDNDRSHKRIGEVEINFQFLDSEVRDNVFRAGPAGLLVTNWFRANHDNVFDGNVWWTTGRPRWQWRTKVLRSFEAWQQATGGEAAGRFIDPLVDDDGRPLPGSPVGNAGARLR